MTPNLSFFAKIFPTRFSARSLFVVTILLGTVFAVFTQHRWEDYYITFRVSRNLVEGNGLVFQPGERVHAFTSPVGVLLPALALKLAGGHSDTAALWIFRTMCLVALGGATVLLWHTACAARWGAFATGLLPILLLTDAKSIDYTINGMETAFMLLCLAAIVHTHMVPGTGAWWKFGLAWGAIMWTRPDGFVFAGAFAFAWIIFLPNLAVAPNRRTLLSIYLRASLVAALIYAPWLTWAWNYYGSPIPNTVVAKGLARVFPSLLDVPRLLFQQSVLFPWDGGVRDAFLPAYVWLGGWPRSAIVYFIGITWVCLMYWLWPKASAMARTFSLTFFTCAFYGKIAPSAPWYVPSHAIFALLTLAAIANDIRLVVRRPAVVHTIFIAHVVICAAMLGAVARQLRVQQAVIERQRTEIGSWLRNRATTPNDSVFLEPLGYIGYFSQLKMLDFPGLAAPEVVAVRRELGDDWPKLIRRLQPDWLVLRRNHAEWFRMNDSALLQSEYQLVRRFDVSAQVAACRFLPGRAYLNADEAFEVFSRVAKRAR